MAGQVPHGAVLPYDLAALATDGRSAPSPLPRKRSLVAPEIGPELPVTRSGVEI